MYSPPRWRSSGTYPVGIPVAEQPHANPQRTGSGFACRLNLPLRYSPPPFPRRPQLAGRPAQLSSGKRKSPSALTRIYAPHAPCHCMTQACVPGQPLCVFRGVEPPASQAGKLDLFLLLKSGENKKKENRIFPHLHRRRKNRQNTSIWQQISNIQQNAVE